jgi:uncharacterized protein YceK
MRNILFTFGVLIFCSGCSTIVMHSQDDPLRRNQARGIYSGVRLDSGLLADKDKGDPTPRAMVIGYSCFDIPFSAVADTFCLPLDLFIRPNEIVLKNPGGTANDHTSAETRVASR